MQTIKLGRPPLPTEDIVKLTKLVIAVALLIFLAIFIAKRLRRNKAPGKTEYLNPSDLDGFDPTALNNSISNDQGGFISIFNSDIYEPILGLRDNQLIAASNDWNKRFYSKHQKTLREVVLDQPWGFFGYSPTKDALEAKFKSAKLY